MPGQGHCALFSRESVGIWRGENLSATAFGGRKTQPRKGHCSKLELDMGGAAGFSLGFGCRNWGKGFSLVSESMVDMLFTFGWWRQLANI